MTYVNATVEKSGSPVDIGSLSHYLRRVFYIPGGSRISEPSTVWPGTQLVYVVQGILIFWRGKRGSFQLVAIIHSSMKNSFMFRTKSLELTVVELSHQTMIPCRWVYPSTHVGWIGMDWYASHFHQLTHLGEIRLGKTKNFDLFKVIWTLYHGIHHRFSPPFARICLVHFLPGIMAM